MEDNKFQYIPDISKTPFHYLVSVKRGVIWSTRLLEITKEKIQYFLPDNNQMRFTENVAECLLTLNEQTGLLILESKSQKFDPVKLKSDEPQTLKKIKIDFDFVSEYITNKKILKERNFSISLEQEMSDEQFNRNVFLLTDSEDKQRKDLKWLYFWNSKHTLFEFASDNEKADINYLKNILGSYDNNQSQANNISFVYLSGLIHEFLQKVFTDINNIHHDYIILVIFASFAINLSIMLLFPDQNIIYYLIFMSIFFWASVVKYIGSLNFKRNFAISSGGNSGTVYLNYDSNSSITIVNLSGNENQYLKLTTFFYNIDKKRLYKEFFNGIEKLKKWNLNYDHISMKDERQYEITMTINKKEIVILRKVEFLNSYISITDTIGKHKICVYYLQETTDFSQVRVNVYIILRNLIETNTTFHFIKHIGNNLDFLHLKFDQFFFEQYIEEINSSILNYQEVIVSSLKNENIWTVINDKQPTFKNEENIVLTVKTLSSFYGLKYEVLVKKEFTYLNEILESALNILRAQWFEGYTIAKIKGNDKCMKIGVTNNKTSNFLENKTKYSYMCTVSNEAEITKICFDEDFLGKNRNDQFRKCVCSGIQLSKTANKKECLVTYFEMVNKEAHVESLSEEEIGKLPVILKIMNCFLK